MLFIPNNVYNVVGGDDGHRPHIKERKTKK